VREQDRSDAGGAEGGVVVTPAGPWQGRVSALVRAWCWGP